MGQFSENLTRNGNHLKNFKIEVRPIYAFEQGQWQCLMKKNHYLGFSGLIGEQMQYIATVNGEWVALLAWACPALKIRDRDAWIGWNYKTKLSRLKYIVNNWRFLILPEFKLKHLASKILSLNLKRLNQDWIEKYSHPILLVETFVEASRFKGTCYKACGWQEIGQTAGFQKHHEQYFHHGKKKRIFMKELASGSREILSSSFIHPIFLDNPFSFRRTPVMNTFPLPLKGPNGLLNFVRTLPDGRSVHGIRHRKEGLMMVAILATLAGAKTYHGILKWAKSLTEEYREEIMLWKIPSLATVRRFIMALDTNKIDQLITGWLLKNDSLKCKVIAVDGKVVRGSYRDSKNKKGIQLLSAVVHDEGTIIAQKQIDSKTNEIPELKNLLKDVNIEGSTVTADALHTQSGTAEFITKKKPTTFLS